MNSKRHFLVLILVAAFQLAWCQGGDGKMAAPRAKTNETPMSAREALHGVENVPHNNELPRQGGHSGTAGLLVWLPATSVALLLVTLVFLADTNRRLRTITPDLKEVKKSADTYNGMERLVTHDDFKQLKDGQDRILQLWQAQTASKPAATEDLRLLESQRTENDRLKCALDQARKDNDEKGRQLEQAKSKLKALGSLIELESKFTDESGGLLSLDELLERLVALDSEGHDPLERALGFDAKLLRGALAGVRSNRAISAGPALDLSRRRPYWLPTEPRTAGLYALLDYCRGRAIAEVQTTLRTEVVAPTRGEPFDPSLHDEIGRSVPPTVEMEGKVCECTSIGFRGLVLAKVLRYGKFESERLPASSQPQSQILSEAESAGVKELGHADRFNLPTSQMDIVDNGPSLAKDGSTAAVGYRDPVPPPPVRDSESSPVIESEGARRAIDAESSDAVSEGRLSLDDLEGNAGQG